LIDSVTSILESRGYVRDKTRRRSPWPFPMNASPSGSRQPPGREGIQRTSGFISRVLSPRPGSPGK
jgi:hypothetical protein